jgi:hypothetical protein
VQEKPWCEEDGWFGNGVLGRMDEVEDGFGWSLGLIVFEDRACDAEGGFVPRFFTIYISAIVS